MAVEGILREIVETTLTEAQGRAGPAQARELRGQGEIRAAARRSLDAALAGGRKEGPRFICEVKKASPSKGLFRADFDPGLLAEAYVKGGAEAVSVVTEPHYFQGSLAFLDAVREAAPRTVLLRKDFHVHEFQIYETAASPADALLFIAGVLSPTQLKDYLDMARCFSLSSLVEVTTLREAETALKAGATVVGVNNRDLRTFEVDVSRTERILPLLLEAECVSVAESGIQDHAAVDHLWRRGVDAFLVGEALVKAPDAGHKLRELRGLLDTDPGP